MIEKKIINHIQKAYGFNLKDDMMRGKLVVIKMSEDAHKVGGDSVYSYLYTSAKYMHDHYGATTIIVDSQVESVSVGIHDALLNIMSKEELTNLHNQIGEAIRDKDNEHIQEQINSMVETFNLLDIE